MTKNVFKSVSEMLVGLFAISVIIAFCALFFYGNEGPSFTWQRVGLAFDKATAFVIICTIFVVLWLLAFYYASLIEIKMGQSAPSGFVWFFIIVSAVITGAIENNVIFPVLFGTSIDVSSMWSDPSYVVPEFHISFVYRRTTHYLVSIGFNKILSAVLSISLQLAAVIASIEGCMQFYSRIVKAKDKS